MNWTRELFDGMGDFYLVDFPLSSTNRDFMYDLFICLPDNIKYDALQWGFNDTEVRDNIFVWLCDKLLNMTPKEYYRSSIAKDYFDNGTQIEMDWNKLK